MERERQREGDRDGERERHREGDREKETERERGIQMKYQRKNDVLSGIK